MTFLRQSLASQACQCRNFEKENISRIVNTMLYDFGFI